MKKILFLSLFIVGCASAQWTPQLPLPKVGHMQKMSLDTLYNIRVDSVSDAIRTQTSRIDIITGSITLTVTDSMFNALEGRVYTNEGKISVFSDLIELRVDSVSYTAEGDTLTWYGSAIDIMKDQIALKVSANDVYSMIEILPDSILIQSKNIVLDGGAVFRAINGDTANSTSINGSKLKTGTVTADSVKASWFSAQTIAADHITDGALGAGVTMDAKVIFRAINGDYTDSTTIDGSHITTGTLTADKISGDTLTGVVINGVDIWASNIIGAHFYSYPTLGLNANGNLVNIEGETISFLSRTWNGTNSTWDLETITSFDSGDITNWNGKADAFTGFTGTIVVTGEGSDMVELTYVNGVLTSATVI